MAEAKYEPKIAQSYVLEIYVPKRLRYLGALYTSLLNQLQGSDLRALLQGFSIYEVDGAFISSGADQPRQIYDEKTLVIRIIYELPEDEVDSRIQELAKQVVSITGAGEEEIWLMRYQAVLYRYIRR